MIDPEAAIEHALDVLAEAAAQGFSATTRTWQTHHPDVFIEKSKGLREVGVDDQIYSYVSRGTDVRRALLSFDFIPKTQPGTIGSGAGAGSFITASKAFSFPGIEAREFDKAIEERIDREVMPKVLEELANELVSMFTETMNK